jgi:arylsulfatase A-like enzyme
MTSRSGPFLAWVHLLDPHASWDRSPLAESFYDAGYRGRYEQAGPGVAFAEHDPAELARLRSLYTGEVFLADRHFGTLLDALTAAGLLERSVLLLTADHGEGLMDHGLLQHGQVYEEDLRIPLVLGVPGLPAGRRVAAPVTQLDVLPTLAGLAGVALEGPVAGRDLTRVPTAAREVVGVAYTDDARRRASLRDEDGTKLVVDCGGGPGAAPPSRQLFDLSVDPGEREDLAAARPERARALEQRLWQALGVSGCAELRMARSSGRGAHEGLDPETVRRLEALGYGGDAR